MHSSYRVAFPPKSNAKPPVQANVDIIMQTANLKMKEFLLKKQENEKKTNLIVGQNKQLENSITYLLEEREEKIKQINKLESILQEVNNDIGNLENEYQNNLCQIMKNEELNKENLNQINSKLNGIQYGTLSEKAKKSSELRKYLDLLYKIKEENSKLKEIWLRKNSELYKLEILYQGECEKESKNELKAQKGIQDINSLYQLGMKNGVKLSEN